MRGWSCCCPPIRRRCKYPRRWAEFPQESEPPRITADLGPTDRLAVAWRQAGAGASAAEIDALLWLKVRPGAVSLDVRLKGNAEAGRLEKLELAVDPRWRLQPPSGPDAPTAQVQNLPERRQIVTLEWAQPLPEQTPVKLSFLMPGALGVGNMQLPSLEALAANGKKLVGNLRRSRVGLRRRRPAADGAATSKELELVAAGDFLKAWGTAEQRRSRRIALALADWSLSTKPREPLISAEPVMALSFDRERIELDYTAN